MGKWLRMASAKSKDLVVTHARAAEKSLRSRVGIWLSANILITVCFVFISELPEIASAVVTETYSDQHIWKWRSRGRWTCQPWELWHVFTSVELNGPRESSSFRWHSTNCVICSLLAFVAMKCYLCAVMVMHPISLIGLEFCKRALGCIFNFWMKCSLRQQDIERVPDDCGLLDEKTSIVLWWIFHIHKPCMEEQKMQDD